MKKSNVVVLVNIMQETYAKLLLEITNMKPEHNLINSEFQKAQCQAKFTMDSPEGAENLLKSFQVGQFEGKDNFQMYIEVVQGITHRETSQTAT